MLDKRAVISNAFSVNMVPNDIKYATLYVARITLLEAKAVINSVSEIHSIVGHSATAELLTKLLERKVEVNREFYTLRPDDILIVFVLGRRLKEGEVVEDLNEIRKTLKVFAITIKY